jgi:pimeloyl-ACP methyl ester carboxylesterase
LTLAARVDGSGPAVLMLHGQPGTGADWDGVGAALSDGFTTVVPDRPGYGRTGGRATGFEGNARAALALLDELGIERATVAGHSWGAGVALALAELAPTRVGALVLVCPVTPLDRLGPIDRFLAHPRAGPAAAFATMRTVGLALELSWLRTRIARLLPGYGDRGGEVARDWVRGPTWRSFHTEQRALFDELPALRDRLEPGIVPATVVIGDHDHVTDPETGRALARELGGRVVEIEGGGHLLPMRDPGRVAEAIRQTASCR